MHADIYQQANIGTITFIQPRELKNTSDQLAVIIENTDMKENVPQPFRVKGLDLWFLLKGIYNNN